MGFEYAQGRVVRVVDAVQQGGSMLNCEYPPGAYLPVAGWCGGPGGQLRFDLLTDPAGRPAGMTYRSVDTGLAAGVEFTFDEAGRLGAVEIAGDRLTYAYDALSRLVGEEREGLGAYRVDVRYTCDPLGRMVRAERNGDVSEYQYDRPEAAANRRARGRDVLLPAQPGRHRAGHGRRGRPGRGAAGERRLGRTGRRERGGRDRRSHGPGGAAL